MRHRASALLLSFFMMTLMISLAVGISALVIRDTATVQTVVAGSQARYAAEGMGELGLKILDNSLPGYEPSLEGYTLSTNALASLEINARGASVPCTAGAEEWRELKTNESVQLALFAQTDGGIKDVDDFYIEFFVADEDGNPQLISSSDILRWKILGLINDNTEAISEYIPLDGNRYTEDNPSIFGSAIPGERAVPDGYSNAKYFSQSGYSFNAAYPISRFLGDHEYSYLILTNVVQDEDYSIFFKLTATSEEAVCEYVSLKSTARVEDQEVKQLLQTLVKEGENLPAFDFVLYHTDEDE